MSNTKSGIHKAYQIDIVPENPDEDLGYRTGPFSRGANWVQVRSQDGRNVKMTMITGDMLDEVVHELEDSARKMSETAAQALSLEELDAIQSTLTGFGLNGSTDIEDR